MVQQLASCQHLGATALRPWLRSVRGTRLLTVPTGRRIRRTARQVPSRGAPCCRIRRQTKRHNRAPISTIQ